MNFRFPYSFAIIAAFLFLISCSNSSSKKLLVVFNPSEASTQILQNLKEVSARQNMPYDTTSNITVITEDTLQSYSSLFLVNYPIDTLTFRQQPDIQRFVEAGGSFMIFSDKTDSVVNWPWMSKNYDRFRRIDSAAVSDNFSNGAIPDYSKATTERVPDENRFVVEVLDTYMYEPMEMVIFKDGRIMYVERRGDIKIYDPKTKKSIPMIVSG